MNGMPIWVWKFVAAIVATLIFVFGIIFSVKLIVIIGTGDFSIAVSQNFWDAFDVGKFSRLVIGMSLAALAVTTSVEFVFERVEFSFNSEWVRNSTAYFTASFAVIFLSTASLFATELPANPGTYTAAFFVVTLCSVAAALVYGLIVSRQYGKVSA